MPSVQDYRARLPVFRVFKRDGTREDIELAMGFRESSGMAMRDKAKAMSLDPEVLSVVVLCWQRRNILCAYRDGKRITQ